MVKNSVSDFWDGMKKDSEELLREAKASNARIKERHERIRKMAERYKHK